MDFRSDNTSPASPEIIQALVQANEGYQNPYGADDYSVLLKNKFSEIFEKEVTVYLTSTGTAANCLALSSLVTANQSIACHKEAHIYTDECGAPSLFTNGAALLLVDGKEGKINAEELDVLIQHAKSSGPYIQKPGCISVTQTTESGTVYSVDELAKINSIAQKYAMPMHMDGARFANSIASLNCTPAEITWKAGIDVMSFGATKNGALSAEAIVFFNQKYTQDFEYTLKRAGQTFSKNRFFACQFLAYFENNLWLRNAKNANFIAQLLVNIFNKFQIKIVYQVQANEVFVELTTDLAGFLTKKGCKFYQWNKPKSLYRFVASYCSKSSETLLLEQYLTEYYKNNI
jgi:threonine aldolase